MPNIQSILTEHQQRYPASCAASAMELLLKFHEKVPAFWFDYQDEFKDHNIGFTELDRLETHQISATVTRLPKAEFLQAMTEETRAGRFSLISLPNAGSINYHTGQKEMGVGWHIWLAVPHDNSFLLVSKTHNCPPPIAIGNLWDVLDRILWFEPAYVVEFVKYVLR